MRLHELLPGQSGLVKALHHQGPRLTRLLEMGLFEGVKITLVRTAPLGDPLELKVGDYNLSLRKDDAAQVELEP